MSENKISSDWQTGEPLGRKNTPTAWRIQTEKEFKMEVYKSQPQKDMEQRWAESCMKQYDEEKPVYADNLFGFLQAFDDEDLPDGAWQAMIEDGVKDYNRSQGTHHDEHDAWLWYIEKKNNND